MDIRRIRPQELVAAHSFVQSLVNETYAYIWSGHAPPIDPTDWSPAWVADDGTGIIALMLSSGDCIEDLWVAAPYRGWGLGSRLLAIGESEIRERNCPYAKLRVVSGNELAVDFYKRRGWTFIRQYRHSRLPIGMMDFAKPVGELPMMHHQLR